MNTKRTLMAVSLALILLAQNLLMVSAAQPQLPPSPPFTVRGHVTFNGENVPENAPLSAWIDGNLVAQENTSQFEDESIYVLTIPADDPETVGVEGGAAGDIISFKLDIREGVSLTADQMVTWASGDSADLDLTVQQLITTAGTLATFASRPGVPSAAQSYQVSGKNLTSNLTITAPEHFQVSLVQGSGYVDSLELTPGADHTLTATTIYVRFGSPTAGACTGALHHTSTGASTVDVQVHGVAYFYRFLPWIIKG